jgi:hypothetical protein
MENSVHIWVHSLKDAQDLGLKGGVARGVQGCVKGSWTDWNHARKYPRLASAGWEDSGFQINIMS